MVKHKPKYQVGDRFIVMDTVKCTIIEVIQTKSQTRYVFQLFDNKAFKSIVTEENLADILAKP